jgi:FKBP-type peptidyl-prolyl cis-trans isomerase
MQASTISVFRDFHKNRSGVKCYLPGTLLPGLWTGILSLLLFSFSTEAASLSADKMAPVEKGTQIEQKKTGNEAAFIQEKYPHAIRTPSGLMYIVLKEGTGAIPKRGAIVEAHYTGRLMDGTTFDSSIDRGHPFQFIVGKGRVIQGWDEAFLSMKKGEKRILIIPPALAYGNQGAGPIPPKATLIFEVELMDFIE